MKDKQQIDTLISSRFSEIGKVLADVVKAKQAYRGELAKIEKFKATYSDDANQSRRTTAKTAYDQARRKVHDGMATKLQELKDAVDQRHAELDLSDPNWQNALKLIELGVRDYATITKINKLFEHSQPALRALQEVYKSKNVPDGGIDKMIYDTDGAFQHLQNLAYQAFTGDGVSITQFANSVARIANFEGVKFDGNPDPDAFSEAMYTGAGLSMPTE